MKALIVGRGWIGNKLHRIMGGTLVSHIDAPKAIRSAEFDVVVNCAGLTGSPNVDACEKKRAETIFANTVYPISLFHLCHDYGARFVHFSSGCIYQGDDFSETDQPNFDASVYSLSKIGSDQYLKDKALVLRIRMPFDGTWDSKNLLTKLSGYSSTARLVDSVNSLSDADEMVRATQILIEGKMTGIYNMVNTGKISTREIAKIMGLDAKWMDWEEFKGMGHGARSVCTLSNEKLQKVMSVREVHEAVEIASRRMQMEKAA